MPDSADRAHPVAGAADWRDDRSISEQSENVCVIGAGASGLCAVKNLRELGFGVDCYERETGVGGAWNWRHDRSPVYASTHLISSKPFSQYPDFPMPDDWPDYPHHSQLLHYLQRYTDHFDLRRHIWFGTEVVRITPAEGDRWDVTTRSTGGSGASRTQRYAAVVVANGHNWAPHEPTYDGLSDFTGQVIHAAAYHDAAQLRGRRVLVVGGGNTGCDIAVEAGQQGARCWHSTRRGYWYLPKYVSGRPLDQLHARLSALPLPRWLRQWIRQRVLRLSVGDLTRFGLPAPDHQVLATHPIVNSQLVHHIGHGSVAPVPDVARFRRHTVELADGSEIDPDLVVLATGYRPRFDFLDPGLLGAGPDGRPRLHLHLFAPERPTLSVVGLPQPDIGIFPLVHWQTVLFARWLRARTADPAGAAALTQRLSAAGGRDWHDVAVRDDSPRHWFEVGHRSYLGALQSSLDSLEVSVR
ncbi:MULTISPECIES: flavin-containing monooxygenase [unclassified Solwaraspora]|uniref:flavin-containing monooxygenase n=1 Tax=unclassified Solwaraspora TaxID=2627926 RepID=UPI00259BB9F8|nr:NAD(P)-binding domain-containing protein [Solwaraspora sp. WMMA2056]WJK43660.1 NAD(P)-binding domain-containing protein [Solwaraspora sp. WMMA2056]